MDKYEFNIKVEQIKKLVGKSDYGTAMKIADTIDWRRVRNTNLLSMVATIYEKNEDYEEAKEILLLAYERAPIGKRLLYKLAELALKQGNIDEAEDYYKEFSDLASDDPRQQLLRYMILKAKGAPAQQLIHSLESYTGVELDEKWLYELAELYSLAGMSDRCVETCDKIMLMFGLGKYVDKAMDLKIQYAPLTNYQLDLVENRDKYEAKLREVEQQYNLGKKRATQEEYQEEPMYQQDSQGGQAYSSGQAYDNSYSEGNYGQEQNYGPDQGYEPAQNIYQDYDQGNGFAPQQNYGQNQGYGQSGYEEGQNYMSGQSYSPGYGPSQEFVEDQAYGQGTNGMPSQEYEAGQAYGTQVLNGWKSVKAQDPGFTQAPVQPLNYGAGQDYSTAQNHGAGQNYGYQQTYGTDAAYSDNGDYSHDQVYGADAAYSDNGDYSHDQAYGSDATYNDSGDYNHDQVYGADAAYGDNGDYSHDQAYGSDATYNDSGDYSHEQTYGSDASYNGNQDYSDKQAYKADSSYVGNQNLMGNTSYGYRVDSVQNSGYSADKDYAGNQEYSENEAYGNADGFTGNEEYPSDSYYSGVSEYAWDHYEESQQKEAELEFKEGPGYGQRRRAGRNMPPMQEYQGSAYDTDQTYKAGQNYRTGQSYEENTAYESDVSAVPELDAYEPQNSFDREADGFAQNHYEAGSNYPIDSAETSETDYNDYNNKFQSEYGADEAYGPSQPVDRRSFRSEYTETPEDDFRSESDYDLQDRHYITENNDFQNGYESDYKVGQFSGKELSAVQDDVEIQLREAEVQEKLAREMSRITHEEPVLQEESKMEHTRVLDDIRRVGRPITAIPRPRGVFMPEEEESSSLDSEPVIEEDIVEGPGLQEDGDDYDRDLPEYSDSDECAGPDVAYRQTAVTSEDQEKPVMASETKAPMYGKQVDVPKAYEEDELEFEDLDEDEKEMPVMNHLMIEARTPEKGMQMAVEALKQIHRENGIKNPVAKINGAKLAKRGILASAEKLAGKDLVVEEAGDLTPTALEELNQLMERDTSNMIVVLIDNPKQMEMLHRDYPSLASKFECIGLSEASPESKPVKASQAHREPDAKPVKAVKPQVVKTLNYRAEEPEPTGYFRNQLPSEPLQEEVQAEEPNYKTTTWLPESYEDEDYYQEAYEEDTAYEDEDFYEEGELEERISVHDEEGPGFHGEEMGIDEFAQYACRYANEIDCSITGKSMLALYERIEILEEDGVPLTRTNAEDLIEEAADRAEKPSFGKRIKGLFSSKYDKDGLLILKEEHFIY